MSNLVRQRQLRHLGRYSTVVIHKRDNSRVQRSFCALVQSPHCLRVRLVLLANATGGTGRGCDPREAKRAAGKVSIREHIGQTKVLVVAQGMDVQEVGHVNVLHAERVGLPRVRFTARRIVVDFDALDLDGGKCVVS